MRSLVIIWMCIVSALPLSAFGAELNAGFVQGLWYANEPVLVSKATRVYVALRNNTDHDLTGTVRFTDNGTRIGVSNVSALPGRLVEAWVDWTPSYGEHTIVASLTDVRINAVGETPGTGEVENTIAEDVIFVDYDTDGDGTPNEADTDDDNDSVSDVDEKKQGTNPLVVSATEVKKTDDAVQSNNSESGGGSDDKDDDSNKSNTTAQSGSSQSDEGLERYIPQKTVRTALASVTETIHETKTNLDRYREKRSDALKEYFDPKTPTDTGTTSESEASTSNAGTITRSPTAPKESFITSSLNAGKALVSGLYTFVLFLISGALAHPAILELLLLIFIILFIYRTARRLGRRRTPN